MEMLIHGYCKRRPNSLGSSAMAASNNNNNNSDLHAFLNDEDVEPNGQYTEIQRMVNLIFSSMMTPTAYTNMTMAHLTMMMMMEGTVVVVVRIHV